MTVKEIQNIFSKETTLTDILLSILPENAEYSDYIREFVNITLEIGENENE